MFHSHVDQVSFRGRVERIGDSSEDDEPIDDPQFVEEHKQWVDSVLKDPMTFTV